MRLALVSGGIQDGRREMTPNLEVPLGEQANQAAIVVDDRDTSDALVLHELEAINSPVIVVDGPDRLHDPRDEADRLVFDCAELAKVLLEELGDLGEGQHALEVPVGVDDGEPVKLVLPGLLENINVNKPSEGVGMKGLEGLTRVSRAYQRENPALMG